MQGTVPGASNSAREGALPAVYGIGRWAGIEFMAEHAHLGTMCAMTQEQGQDLTLPKGEAFLPGGRNLGAYVEMLVGSLLSLVASFVLSVDAVKLAADPLSELSCNISEKISCASVGLSWQASVLGFPNSFIGLIAEPVVITLAVAGLAGITFPRWFMLAAQVVYTAGLVFALWLFHQSYFVIGALCPWCLLVTATTIVVFASMTRINILQGNLSLPGKAGAYLRDWTRLGADVALTAIAVAVLTAMVLYRYL